MALSVTTGAYGQKANDTLRIAFETEVDTLDMYFTTLRQTYIMSQLVYDTLVYRHPETGAYSGLLAESWERIDDQTLEFRLRQGVTFHNGEPFNADDVVHTLNHMIAPDSGIRTVRNVGWIASVERVDDYTVRVNSDGPFPPALEYLSGPVVIYPDEYYAEVGPERFGVAPVGTGPYRVTEIVPGQRFEFERNEDYHAASPKGRPDIGRIVARTIPDANTRLAELLSGGLDWIWRLPTDQAERIEPDDDFRLVNAETMRIGFVYLDAAGRTGDDNPLTDVRVRRAIIHAIDREAIVDNLIGGASEVVHAACYPSQFGCEQDVARYAYDPERARALLAEAGYPEGFEIRFGAYAERTGVEAMAAYLEAVGITVNFNFNRYAAVRELIHGDEMPMAQRSWGSYSINDVSAITSAFFKHSQDDFARDDDVLNWLEVADTTADEEARLENYSKALQRIADQAYWIPTWTFNRWYMFSSDLDFTPTVDELQHFYRARWVD
ncbi:MAG: ABC transporter substrate-binding protein [Roseitalea sp.]|nr:ABC transporter substrate-binding protein [Roseitalea sp.]MBO6721208.1 ABC transporter substrate-binding protein [Roseitalea sp.]MBO6744266.1 ABC transporter substrate-binding protein [Roseitalea sp.]